MIRVAFASDDRLRVNQHFGAAEGFVVYEISAERTAMVALGEFSATAQDGNEDKLVAKIEFLTGCAAVFVMAVGASAIKQLLAADIQPVRVNEPARIGDLLADIQSGLRSGGVPWIDKALAAARSPDRFSRMADEAWTD
jgi:nitrogen fixation protein NifX